MTNRKEMVERRKHKRFKVQKGVFAAFRPPSTTIGQIIDISRRGLAFRYIDGEEPSNESSELDILIADNTFHVDKVPFETISDFEIGNEFPFSSMTLKRRGVQFGEMTHSQISQLDYFMQHYTIAEA